MTSGTDARFGFATLIPNLLPTYSLLHQIISRIKVGVRWAYVVHVSTLTDLPFLPSTLYLNIGIDDSVVPKYASDALKTHDPMSVTYKGREYFLM